MSNHINNYATLTNHKIYLIRKMSQTQTDDVMIVYESNQQQPLKPNTFTKDKTKTPQGNKRI